MNYLKVQLRAADGQLLGEGSKIKVDLRPSLKSGIFSFWNFDIATDRAICKDEVIGIFIFTGNESLYAEFEVIVQENVNLGRSIVVVGDCLQYGTYEQDVVDIFAQWDQGVDLNWNDIPAESREPWLLAVMCRSDMPTSIRNDEIFKIDASLINSLTDFYCVLGEVLVGKFGYIGLNLDALDDCLGSLQTQFSTRTIQIKNFKKLKGILEKRRAGYADKVIECFKRYGFKIDIL